MLKKHKAQCGSKLFMIDSFESNGVSVQVYIFENKQSVKRYCRDSGLEFKEGIDRLYNGYNLDVC